MMEDMDKTIAPRRMPEFEPEADLTVPGKRDRKPDGRFDIGDLIQNRYEVLAELGRGGMGVVYKCFDKTAGVEVALKALPPDLSHNTLEMEDVKDNFQLVAKLVHQNIAISKTLEWDERNGNYYLIMECCEGENLRHWIKQKRREGALSFDEVLPVIRQIAEALDYAHKKRVMHRDIKPGNIMIANDGSVKVLDFGLAAQIRTSMSRVSQAYCGTSGTGSYMAPEQWRGRRQGAYSDQYSLAVMTYEMLAGYLPFESSDPAVLQQAVLTQEPEVIEGVPEHIQAAILKAMSKNPAERFESCIAFVEALENNSSPDSEQKSAPEPAPAPSPEPEKISTKKQSSSLKNWIIAFMALLIIGVIFYITNRTTDPVKPEPPKPVPVKPESPKPAPVKPEPPKPAPVADLTPRLDLIVYADNKKVEAWGLTPDNKSVKLTGQPYQMTTGKRYSFLVWAKHNGRIYANTLELTCDWNGTRQNKFTLQDLNISSRATLNTCEKAFRGDAAAQCSLGFAYGNGKGVHLDYSEAVKWYRKSADQGNAFGQYNLGWCYANGKGVPQDWNEAVKWYRKSAEQGNAFGRYNLGLCYETGKGVTPNIDEAVKWYRKSAEQGNAAAQFSLGLCYSNGKGVPQDWNEAVKWYRKSAEQGNALGQNNLGRCYENGKGVHQDWNEAVKWYRKSADQGNAFGQNNLGLCYAYGKGVPQDWNEAVKLYRTSAEQGNVLGQYNLGCCYSDGKGVHQDYSEAVKWYRKSAKQGNAFGQNNLGRCYENGKGVPQDWNEAVKWYRKSADQGNAFGQNNLGRCYETGKGVPQDRNEAVKWYRKSAEQGNVLGQYNLGCCYSDGKGVHQDYSEAVKWYRKSAKQGYAFGQNNLGWCYENGKGVPQDWNEAVKLYRKSAEQGNVDGQYNLGVCYETGKGVTPNIDEAVKWYRKAAGQGDEDAKNNLRRLGR